MRFITYILRSALRVHDASTGSPGTHSRFSFKEGHLGGPRAPCPQAAPLPPFPALALQRGPRTAAPPSQAGTFSRADTHSPREQLQSSGHSQRRKTPPPTASTCPESLRLKIRTTFRTLRNCEARRKQRFQRHNSGCTAPPRSSPRRLKASPGPRGPASLQPGARAYTPDGAFLSDETCLKLPSPGPAGAAHRESRTCRAARARSGCAGAS